MPLPGQLLLARFMQSLPSVEAQRIQEAVPSGAFGGLRQNQRLTARILIDERDDVMAQTLRQIEESRGGIVAVVGEGHVDGLVRHLVGVPVEVVHLEQLRSPPAGPNASVNVSVHL